MLRKFAKAVEPPVLAEHRLGGRLYATWEAAKAAAGGYESELLNRFKVARVAGYEPEALSLEATLLGLVARTLGNPDLVVTDLGGGAGELGDAFLATFREATYVVVENPALVKMLGGDRSVQFTTEMPPSCDIFFSSGTLQYLDDPSSAIDGAFSTARKAVVLARTSFSDEELFRVQRSRLYWHGRGPVPPGFSNVPITLPHRTVREQLVHQAAERHGFDCVATIAETDGVLPYREKVYSRQIAFVRRPQTNSC